MKKKEKKMVFVRMESETVDAIKNHQQKLISKAGAHISFTVAILDLINKGLGVEND